jgi:hypothetical protein
VIDDDESLNAAAGAALKHPLEFYQRAVDNHPPGTAWFYFFVQKLNHQLADPRLARLILIVLLALTAWILGEIAHDLAETRFKKRAREITAFVFFIAAALPSPKNIAVTNEGLMLPLISIAIGVWIQAICRHRKIRVSEQLVSGFLLAFALLVKQTAVFFILPILVCVRIQMAAGLIKLKEASIWMLCMAVYLAFVFQGLGLTDFIYWNFTYPSLKLVGVRDQLFSSNTDLLVNSMVFLGVLWPICLAPFRRGSEKTVDRDSHSVLWAWILAGGAAIILGRGLFFHYYLLILPPLCIFTGVSWAKSSPSRRFEWSWLGFFYAVSCVLAAIPMIQVVWGNDLFYYERIAQKTQSLTTSSDSVFVWGGTASALAFSQRSSPFRFVNSRFVAPPYWTQETQAEFHREFLRSPPKLFLDLHERGDNEFRVAPGVYPWLAQELAENYSLMSDPTLPWSHFYVRRDNSEDIKLSRLDSTSLDFTTLNHRLVAATRSDPKRLGEIVRKNLTQLRAWDLQLKSWLGLEIFCQTENCDSETARKLYADLSSAISARLKTIEPSEAAHYPGDSFSQEDFAQRLTLLYQSRHYSTPYPLSNPMWWASYAVVKLQAAIVN